MTQPAPAPRTLVPPDWWWHEAHALHDHAHHLAHRALDLCVPLWDAPPETREAEAAAQPQPPEPHTHPLYDCGGKGHGSDASEVQWCHDCTPHAAQPQPSGALREALINSVPCRGSCSDDGDDHYHAAYLENRMSLAAAPASGLDPEVLARALRDEFYSWPVLGNPKTWLAAAESIIARLLAATEEGEG